MAKRKTVDELGAELVKLQLGYDSLNHKYRAAQDEAAELRKTIESLKDELLAKERELARLQGYVDRTREEEDARRMPVAAVPIRELRRADMSYEPDRHYGASLYGGDREKSKSWVNR